MEKIHKKEKGITIITLVITIIILLILAGISIAALVGNEGLINKAKKAKSDYENVQEEELAMLDEYGNFIDSGNVENNSSDKGITDTNVLEKISQLEQKIENMQNSTFSLDLVYPIGAIYMSVSNEDPSTLFGGTWVAWGNGRVPVSVGNNGTTTYVNAEETGGNETISHTHGNGNTGSTVLNVNQIPAHSHYIAWQSDGSIVNGNIEYSYVGGYTQTAHLTATGMYGGGYVSNTGGGQGHDHTIASTTQDIRQPYITCYMWKRTE